MNLTIDDYKGIAEWLAQQYAVKDTDFEDAQLPYSGEELIAIVQGEKNAKSTIRSIASYIADPLEESFNSSLGGLANQLTLFNATIEDLRRRISTLTDGLTAIQGTISEMQNRLGSLEALHKPVIVNLQVTQKADPSDPEYFIVSMTATVTRNGSYIADDQLVNSIIQNGDDDSITRGVKNNVTVDRRVKGSTSRSLTYTYAYSVYVNNLEYSTTASVTLPKVILEVPSVPDDPGEGGAGGNNPEQGNPSLYMYVGFTDTTDTATLSLADSESFAITSIMSSNSDIWNIESIRQEASSPKYIWFVVPVKYNIQFVQQGTVLKTPLPLAQEPAPSEDTTYSYYRTKGRVNPNTVYNQVQITVSE